MRIGKKKKTGSRRGAVTLSALGAMLALGAVALIVGVALAATEVDLTTANSSQTYNDAIFTQGFLPNAGTGNIDPFLSIGGSSGDNGVTRGYNTEPQGNCEYNTAKCPADYTHSLLVSAIPEQEIGGISYRELALDINKTGGTDTYLSMDELKLWLTPETNGEVTGYQSDTGLWYGPDGLPGTGDEPATDLIWDLGDGVVLMDYDLAPGSGKADITVLVPSSYFDTPGEDCSYGGIGCTTYAVVWSEFGGYDQPNPEGGDWKNNDGFEEWGTILRPVVNVSKDAVATYDRTVDWTIVKSVDPDSHDLFAGDEGTSGYSITVTRNEETSNEAVSGTITILNPTGGDGSPAAPIEDSIDAVITSVDDVITQGALETTAVVDCGVAFPYTLRAGDSLICTYSASPTSVESGVNEATVTVESLDDGDDETPPEFSEFSGTADVAFTENLIGFDEIHVDDTNPGGDFGPVDITTTHEYDGTFDCGGVEYIDGVGSKKVPNTATIVETGLDDEANVTVTCYAPVVMKDVDPDYPQYSREYLWDITKVVDEDTHTGFPGDDFLSNYDVDVVPAAVPFEEFGWVVAGTIYVTNPSGSAMTVAVADSVGGVPATVDCDAAVVGDQTTLTIPGGETGTCAYFAELPDGEDRVNTATVTMLGADYTATADVIFDDPTTEINATVNVTDTFAGPLGSVMAPDSGLFEYPREFECPAADSGLYIDGIYEELFPNTATIVETGQTASEEVTVTCYLPTIEKAAAGTYDATHHWDVKKTVLPPSQSGFIGDTVNFMWTITVNELPVTEDNFDVAGTITVTNPSPYDELIVALSDELSDGAPGIIDPATCAYEVATGLLTVGVSSSETCSYAANDLGYTDVASAPDTNTATMTLNGVAYPASYPIEYVANPINDSATLDDIQFPYSGKPVFDGWTSTYPDTYQCSRDLNDYENGADLDNPVVNVADVYSDGGLEASSTAATEIDCYLPSIMKSAAGTYGELHVWEVTKTVDPERQSAFAGEKVGFEWTITVDETVTQDAFNVSGLITIGNPNPEDDLVVPLIDVLSDGTIATILPSATCAFDGTNVTVPANNSSMCEYTASVAGITDVADAPGLNTATIVLNEIPFSADDPIEYAPTITYEDAFLFDDYEFDNTPVFDGFKASYSGEYTCSTDLDDYEDGPDLGNEVSNLAELYSDGDLVSDSLATTVIDCYIPAISKVADGTYDERHEWRVEKTVSPTDQSGFAGDTVPFVWRIEVFEDIFEENFGVAGTITVDNPNPEDTLVVPLVDAVNGNPATIDPATCDFDGTNLTVAAGGSETCGYEVNDLLYDDVDLAPKLNTATITLNGIVFAAEDPIEYTPNVINGEAVLNDDHGSFTDRPVVGGSVIDYDDDYTCSTDLGEYTGGEDLNNEVSNTAIVTSGGEEQDRSTATTEIDCYIPVVDKSADPAFTRTYHWTIEKEAFLADGSVVPYPPEYGLILNQGQSYLLQWKVFVALDDPAYTDSDWSVSGWVEVQNLNPDAPMEVTVADVLSDGTPGDINPASCTNGATLVEDVLTVLAGTTTRCRYTAADPDGNAVSNTFTATLNELDFAATAGFDYTVPTTEVNATVLVTDSFMGGPEQVLGTVTATEGSMPFTIETLLSSDPTDEPDVLLECEDNLIVNRADIWNFDGDVKGAFLGYDERPVLVNVLCDLGCTLTQGYWKTHNDSFWGGAPTDETWELLGDADGDGVEEAEQEGFFLSGQTYFEVMWTPSKGNVYYNLARQYIAAELNFLNGADPSAVADEFAEATAFFETYTPDETAAWKKGRDKKLRQYFTKLAEMLTKYNEGDIGPGHCDEDYLSQN